MTEQEKVRLTILALCLIVGSLLMSYGIYLIYPPAAWISLGALVVLSAIVAR